MSDVSSPLLLLVRGFSFYDAILTREARYMTWNFPYGIQIVFRYPERLWALTLIVMVLLFVWQEMKQRRAVLHDPWLQLHLPVSSLPSLGKRIRWWLAASVALTCTIAAFAVPERKFVDKENIYGRLRLTFLFDVSLSMVRGEDVKPNRMRAAKNTITAFVDMLMHDQELHGRYSLALIPFAGTAQPFFLTFTTSREEFLSSMEEMNERTISRQGTSLLAALLGYRSLLSRHPAREETVDIAILISDGGQEEGKEGERNFFQSVIGDIGDIVSKNTTKSIKAPPWHVTISTVGIGNVKINEKGGRTAEATELIIRDGMGNFIDFYREKQGNTESPVLKSRLDEEILMEIARLGKGTYYHFSDTQKMVDAFRELVLAHRIVVDEVFHARYEPALSWFLVPAFALWYVLFGFSGWIAKTIYYSIGLVKRLFFV
ncbi:MAG: VWA domain-containing protein [Patescibacteria group bacterium]